MQISRFGISRLLNEEWFRFHTEFVTLALACGIAILEIARVFALYEPLYKEIDKQLEMLRLSFHTTETSEFDTLRKDMFRGLRDSAKSWLKSIVPDNKAAAEKVYAVAKKYDHSIMQGSLPARTAAIDNFLQDLTSTEGGDSKLAAEVQLLGLGKLVTGLQEANDNYKAALAIRTEEIASRPKVGRLLELRKEMDQHYTSMTTLINTILLGIPDTADQIPETQPETPGGSGPVEEIIPTGQPATTEGKILHFAKQLNACIARYHALLKGRDTRKKNQSDNDDDTDIDIPDGNDEEDDIIEALDA